MSRMQRSATWFLSLVAVVVAALMCGYLFHLIGTFEQGNETMTS